MARLEDLTTGARVTGVAANQSVTVVQVQWHGTQAITLTYRDDAGRPGEQLLYRDNEPDLTVEQASTAWSFTADGALFRLVSEARRIELAYLFDPLLAVTTSNVMPLPHQITAVYEEMLQRQPLHFLLADDPGAGKTIMAGLLIKELMIRGDVKRCLIVCPGMLVDQWQDELHEKFHLRFDIVTRDMVAATHSGNPFLERNLLIARLDHLSRNEEMQARLAQSEWDLVVCDEAHKMAAHYFGSEVKETKRYKLGKLLGELSRQLLLMTATPHSGKPEDFDLFMALLDADRFAGKLRGKKADEVQSARDLMRRLSKEQLRTMDGRPLFPERRAYTVKYTLSEPEAYLYQEVTAYVRDEMNRADSIAEEGGGRRRMAVGLALTTLQRRLASSPAAIHESIKRRLKRLEGKLAEARIAARGAAVKEQMLVAAGAGIGAPEPAIDIEDWEELDDLPDDELEELEEQVVDQASAARTIAELEAEIETLKRLEQAAQTVRASGMDRKWEQLSSLVQEGAEMFDANGQRRKMIIFSEHRDTLNYLVEKLRTVLGRAEAVVAIHGGLGREERRKAQEFFMQDKDVIILVATDAAGEGINLQRAHLMVNYDLPWNPNRIEQRFGRIHRIGQTEVCHLWNLVAHETREGQVFERLLEKLDEQRKALGDQVFDVLSDSGVFSDESLRDLLLEAIRYGDQPEVRARLFQQVDEAMGGNLNKVLAERALARDVMGGADVERIRDEMEKAEARKLQPHFIRTFFAEGFARLGGKMSKRETSRYEITYVPADIRTAAAQLGSGIPVLRRYERVTFDREAINVPGKPTAEFICPGHPLLDATIDVIQQRHRMLLCEGAILVADVDLNTEPRALVYLEHAIQDGRLTPSGERRVVSKRFEFVEVGRDGKVQLAGYAPYLDYRPITCEERELIAGVPTEDWLASGLESTGMDYAIETAVPEHLAEVKRRTLDRITRTEAAVKDRLTKEINYWDHRADQLKEQELAGKKPRLNSGKARQRAEEMADRLKRRIEELAQEKQLSPLPPVVVGGALIIPAGLLRSLGEAGKTAPPSGPPEDTTITERIAVEAVMAMERELGCQPEEQDHNNPGFDILSKDPIKAELRFIEVKGRVAGAPNFTVTKTEVLTALNKPDAFILAMVSVDDGAAKEVRYLRQPFAGSEETFFDTTSVDYDWHKLFDRGMRPT
jgi:SNF2 family DNA or RNA helicase